MGLDIEDWSLSEDQVKEFVGTKEKRQRAPKHGKGEWFLKGPVPWTWLEVAARQPGKALALGLSLWREVGRRKGKQPVKLSMKHVGLGVDDQAARRALKALEKAGLVSLSRQPGQSIAITLLKPENPAA